ncbi:uncharacterized protein C8Q71DRAFT_894828 [Rhodofomes roseus]|uniref:Uncharacterized protein n=1 Tax=Rhodofomes roseus TaxID=34475 RepID=A0ABQ8KMP9_9APHY|nr:uncharacterized protein C8Q71DRAFT_894828 [Rhodofomes roseus]KAH9839350.1 hypothetical protein C8Q71DRAFT_894828 [Rhodofomes roseus]
MVLIIALLNDGTIMTLSDLAKIFAYAVAYGLYLTLSTIALVAICIKTTFFYDKFGVLFEYGAIQATNHNDRVLRSIVYLQVAICLTSYARLVMYD